MEQEMYRKASLVWAAGLIALAAAGTGAEAAPAGALANPEVRAGAAGMVETVHYRRCRWFDGHRVCRWYRSPSVRRYGYPEDYKTGSSDWWQEMDRTDRGGRGSRR
jgi:uncharacterized protein YodC (DUF2158 family)